MESERQSVTDSVVAQTTFVPQAENKDKPVSETEHMQGNHGTSQHGIVNLSEAIRWLLDRHAENGGHLVDHDEEMDRQRRQHDLLLWLFNLEPRLTPYSEPG